MNNEYQLGGLWIVKHDSFARNSSAWHEWLGRFKRAREESLFKRIIFTLFNCFGRTFLWPQFSKVLLLRHVLMTLWLVRLLFQFFEVSTNPLINPSFYGNFSGGWWVYPLARIFRRFDFRNCKNRSRSVATFLPSFYLSTLVLCCRRSKLVFDKLLFLQYPIRPRNRPRVFDMLFSIQFFSLKIALQNLWIIKCNLI